MPLEKAPAGSAGFKRNIKREIEAGKPQKQAVAIAYSKSREKDDEHRSHIHMPQSNIGVRIDEDLRMPEMRPKLDTEEIAKAVPQKDGDLLIKHLCDDEEEKFKAACDRADSISHRVDQLEKRDALKSITE